MTIFFYISGYLQPLCHCLLHEFHNFVRHP